MTATQKQGVPLPPYVGLYEAIRIVVGLLPDGAQLAPLLTDEWIKGGYASFDPIPTNDASMRSLYGEGWRETGPKAINAFRKAVQCLKDALKLETVGLAGVVDGARRKVEGDKRHRILQIREGLLATPPGETPVSHPAILNLQICVEDLRREVADMLDPPRYGSNAMKRRAIAEQIKRYGLQKLDDMGPDEAALTIANRVKTAYDGLIVSSAAIRAQITAHKERAASGIG